MKSIYMSFAFVFLGCGIVSPLYNDQVGDNDPEVLFPNVDYGSNHFYDAGSSCKNSAETGTNQDTFINDGATQADQLNQTDAQVDSNVQDVAPLDPEAKECINSKPGMIWCSDLKRCQPKSEPYFCVSMNDDDKSYTITDPRFTTALDAIESCPTSNTRIKGICDNGNVCDECSTLLFVKANNSEQDGISSDMLCSENVPGYCVNGDVLFPLDMEYMRGTKTFCRNLHYKFYITCVQVGQWRIDYLK
jgi:hypothetical protein